MTEQDKELLERMQEWWEYDHGYLIVKAADRIEELVKERDFILSNQTYSYLGKNLKRWLARDLEDAKDAAEAKLNKAVEALREIYEVTVDQKQIDMHVRGWVEVYTRSVLSELEGKE